MKRTAKTILIALLLISPALAIASSPPGQRIISVTGDAEIRVVPDEVVLTLGIETWDTDLNTAKKENDARIKKVIAVATRHNIKKKHIQTDYLEIEPRYENSHRRKKFIGHFVRKTVAITLGDLSQFEALLSGVLDAGANFVHGIQFRTTQLRKYRDQARLLAINAAKEKADDIAAALGQTVGEPHTIQESRTGWQSGYSGWAGSRWSPVRMQNVVHNINNQPETDGTIALGHIKVTASIFVSFELK